ncbi:MAG: hypothetical protein AAF916_04825 [Planctomycetota bacterium]
MNKRHLFLVGSVTSLALSIYSGWVVVRASPFVRWEGEPEFDRGFPRSFPYPDHLIVAWERRLEGRYLELQELPLEFIGIRMMWATTSFLVLSAGFLVTWIILHNRSKNRS